MQAATILKEYMFNDYLETPDDNFRYEIIDGKMFRTSSATTLHQKVSGNLSLPLYDHIKKNKLGEFFTARLAVILNDTNIVEPDIMFISNKNKGIIIDWIRGVPDFLIEITSDVTEATDRTLKKSLYEHYGVLEYWIVDPMKKAVEQFVLKNGKYFLKGLFTAEQKISSETVKEFEVNVGKIFE